MATAKRSKKPARKPSHAASAKQRKSATAQSPEEMLKQHSLEVKDLGNRIIAVIEKSKYHPTVTLDTLQVLLSAGIGGFFGEEHQELWNAYVSRFHDESNLLSILGRLAKETGTEPAVAPEA